ncbi:LexA family protein [Lentilactobacillus kosonis]|uniref:SOS-response repressor and protease LexA n=1 Tax=Lentilactobacillus kosonis TaxID=2810561 RepID=A0A401FPU6_9LACO|nr:XRE family transcriptional regulator [Lentilactobacillus kosonis]GAY74231.1 SOS-response repressor and protease LexA [Lentilactobacillus kosonis]
MAELDQTNQFQLAIGTRIRQLRTQKKLSQKDLANKINLNRAVLNRIENGTRPIRDTELLAIANVLGVTADYLLGRKMKPTNHQNMPSNGIPVEKNDFVNVPIIGTIKAGPNGLALEDHQGFETISKWDLETNQDYFWLIVSGDSMTGDGIHDGDYALIQRTPLFENGDICAVIVDSEEGTLKHVTRSDKSIILTASNPKYQPRIFAGNEINDLTIAGRLVETKRKY